MAKVSINRCTSYNKGEVRDALHLVLGKIDASKSFKGKRVLVKPNLLGAFPPSEAVTTHPAIVEAVVEYIRDNGGSPVVGDSPGGSPLNAEKVFQVTGMRDMAERTGVELINLGNTGTAVAFCWGPEKIMGNILNDNFFEKWNSSLYFELRRSVIRNKMDQCKSCGFSHVRKSGIEYLIISSLLRFRSRFIEPRKLTTKNVIT